MKKILFGMLIIITILSCTKQTATLLVTLVSSIDYTSENGEFIVAQYYTLSDDSLNFVKLLSPDGSEITTLPQAVSASGVRYTDDFMYRWWTKGESATFERRDNEGNWLTVGQFTKK
ncbi:MAG: MliC family protein [Treponemataceae bacterium]